MGDDLRDLRVDPVDMFPAEAQLRDELCLLEREGALASTILILRTCPSSLLRVCIAGIEDRPMYA